MNWINQGIYVYLQKKTKLVQTTYKARNSSKINFISKEKEFFDKINI